MKALTRIAIPLLLLFTLIALAGCSDSNDEKNPDMVLEMVDLINAERSANSLPALTHNLDLSHVAQLHADDMVARNFLGHVNPDGHDYFWRVTDAGIAYAGLGENVSAGHFNMKAAHDAFMLSPAHRDNILQVAAQDIGVGIAQGVPNSDYGQSFYVCVLFLQRD